MGRLINADGGGAYIFTSCPPPLSRFAMPSFPDRAVAEFAVDVLSYPVGRPVYVCASWLDGDAPDRDEVGAEIEADPELVMHHTRRDFSDDNDGSLVAAAYRDENYWMIRVRDMHTRPDRPTKLISEIVSLLQEKIGWSLRYTFTTNHFDNFDLYVAHVEPQRIHSQHVASGEPGADAARLEEDSGGV